MTFLFLLRAMY